MTATITYYGHACLRLAGARSALVTDPWLETAPIYSDGCRFRIHGPIPDCRRFTEHGLKVLLKNFELVELDTLETPGRELFPIHDNALCGKLGTVVDVKSLHFRLV